MKRVAAGAHLPTPWLFEPAKRPDDRADYCLDCSFLPQWKHRVLVFTLEWRVHNRVRLYKTKPRDDLRPVGKRGSGPRPCCRPSRAPRGWPARWLGVRGPRQQLSRTTCLKREEKDENYCGKNYSFLVEIIDYFH